MKKVYLFAGCCFLLACGIFIGRAVLFDRTKSGLNAPIDVITPEKPLESVTSSEETTVVDVENADVTEYTIEKITEAETAAPATVPIETEPPETQKPISLTEAIVTEMPSEDETQTSPPETDIPQVTAEDTTVLQATDPPVVPSLPQIGENLIDFNALQKKNHDIYAWITVGGTVIDYPILQHPTDDEFYLSHAYDGSDYIGGSVFTQGTYNTKTFDDPVTLIYAHTLKSGIMFGSLQPTYSDPDGFGSHSDIKIYLPGEVRHYTVFAAVPYDNRHILWNYDFSNEYWYKNFFASIFQIRSIGSNFNNDIVIEPGDRVIVLSTCLRGDDSHRYLVMAVLNDDI